MPSFCVACLRNFAIVGGFFSALSGIRQNDIKRVVAFSSITHISCICFLVLMSDKLSNFATISILISHGMVRPILFRLVDVLSSRTGTRSISYNLGIKEKIINLSILWLLTLALNSGFPPRVNFIGEIASFAVIYNLAPFSLPLIFLVFVVSE